MLHDVFRSELFGLGGVNRTAAFWHAVLAPKLALLGHRLTLPERWREDCPPALRGFAEQHRLAAEPASWVRLFSDPIWLPAVQTELAVLRGVGLVLGWELSPNIMRALAALGIAFIDAGIDALRFCPDLFLRLRSNAPRLAETLAALAVPDARVHAATGNFRPAPAALTRNAVLFAGQMPIDASLIAGGALARAGDFAAPIAAMLGGRRLLLKPHPHAAPHEDIRALHAAIPDSAIVTDPVYALLAAPGLAEVLTISSSVADEAAWFGKPARRLIVPDAAPGRMARVSPFHRIDAAFCTAGFWDRLLSHRPARIVPPEPAARSLRQIFSYDWGWAAQHRPPSSRRIAPGMRLGFARDGTGTGCLGFGWSAAEDWGVWSDGELATLLLCPAGAPGGLVLRLECLAFVPDPGHPPALHVTSRPEGVVLHRVLKGQRPPLLEIAVPPALCGRGCVEIVFRLSDLSSPQAAGLSGDPRRLGLGLLSLAVA